MLGQIVGKKFMQALERVRYGSMAFITPDGVRHEFAGEEAGPNAVMEIRDWKAMSAFAMKGDIGLTEAYRDQLWDTPDLTAVLHFGLKNEEELEKFIFGNAIFQAVAKVAAMFKSNTIKGSKRNIRAHYDLGNEFYKLWLDPSMTYSSALYKDGAAMSLQAAQDAKYDRMIERVGTSGNVLEIGCGWGGFADRALSRGDYDIKGITLSNEQHDYAIERLRGHGDAAKVVLEDYRHQQGKYDSIVSIEMFEAVGENYWPTYFSKVADLLSKKGKAMIQTITIGDEYFESYRSGSDMIRQFIFPGGMLPSETRFAQEAAKAGLQVTDKHRFGLDYARTLQEWLETFEAKRKEILAMGFDEKFIRVWRFYLAACIASFNVNRTGVMQVELQHA